MVKPWRLPHGDSGLEEKCKQARSPTVGTDARDAIYTMRADTVVENAILPSTAQGWNIIVNSNAEFISRRADGEHFVPMSSQPLC